MTATGAWFTSNDKGTANNIDGKFGTISIAYEDGETAAWSALDKTGSNEYVMPGSSITLAAGTITNNSNVSSYIKVKITNLVVKIGGVTLSEAQIKGLFGVEAVPAFGVTLGNGVTAVDGKDYYLATAGSTVTMKDLQLKIATDVKNGDALSVDGKTVESGSVVNFTYQIEVAAIQADYVEANEGNVDELLNAMFSA